MNRTLTISVITIIVVVMVTSVVSSAMAKEGNNGSNGCKNSNPNSKACEKNPNSERTVNLFFHDADNNPIPDTQCTIYDASFSSGEDIEGITDTNGILTGSFTPEVEQVGVYCLYEDISSIICQTNLTGFNTDIDLELGQYYCPTGI